MNINTHLIVGLVGSAMIVGGVPNLGLTEILASSLGSAIVDIDHGRSTMGRGFPSWLFYSKASKDKKAKGEHVSFSRWPHSLISCFIMTLLISGVLGSYLGLIFGFSYLLHLVIDCCTTLGVPLLNPMTDHHFRSPIYCASGSKVGHYVMIIVALTLLYYSGGL